MQFAQSLLLVASLLGTVFGDHYTISLGDISTYPVTVTTSGTLTGTTLSVQLLSSATSAAIPQSGINLVLSPALQNAVNSILVSPDCGTKVNLACTQALTQAFNSASLDIQSRQLQVIPLILLGIVVAEIVGIIGGTIGILKTSEGIHLPPEQLSQMVAAATATEIVFATGTNAPYASITPPSASKISATSQVSISTATAPVSGQALGDISISITPALAGRIQEVIARESCFGLGKRTGDIGNAICGGQALVFESQPAGSLFELQFVQGIADGNPFNIQWATDTLNEGASQVIQFAQAMAPVLRLGATGAAALGALAFALAIVQDLNGQNINALNTIPATAIDTSTTSSTCAVTSCFAGCEMDGAIQACSTACNTISTASNCNTSPTITTTAFLHVNTGPIQSTTCSVVSTPFPHSLQTISGTTENQYYYTCGTSTIAINIAVSGTSTISYPNLGTPPRFGFTQIPALNGHAVVATGPQPPLPYSDAGPLPTVTLVDSSPTAGSVCSVLLGIGDHRPPCQTPTEVSGQTTPVASYGVIHPEGATNYM